MEKEEYKLHSEYEKTNWWFVAKRKYIQNILKTYVTDNNSLILLDIGCGAGMTSEVFSARSLNIGLDISYEALDYCRDKHYSYLLCGSGSCLPIADESINIVISLDALEHMEDDVAFKDIYRISKDEGLFIFTVPAFSLLWTSRDKRLRHLRRYNIPALKARLSENRFSIQKITYTNLLLFPVLLLKACIEKYIKHPINDWGKDRGTVIIVGTLLNSILIALLSFERILTKYINLPVGTSILCIARKYKDN